MSRAHDLAWAAGFFDGEGYVTIGRRATKYRDKVYNGHYLRTGINHVRPEPLYEMQRLFGGKITQQPAKGVVGNRKQRHQWKLSTSAAAEMLEQLMPYLRNKQQEAQIGLDFNATMQSHGKQVSEETHAIREEFKQRLEHVNLLG